MNFDDFPRISNNCTKIKVSPQSQWLKRWELWQKQKVVKKPKNKCSLRLLRGSAAACRCHNCPLFCWMTVDLFQVLSLVIKPLFYGHSMYLYYFFFLQCLGKNHCPGVQSLGTSIFFHRWSWWGQMLDNAGKGNNVLTNSLLEYRRTLVISRKKMSDWIYSVH